MHCSLPLTQSLAIVRYLANKHKSPLFPIGNAVPQAKIDMVVELIKNSIAVNSTCPYPCWSPWC